MREELIKFRDEILKRHQSEDLMSITLGPSDTEAMAHLVDFLEEELEQDVESLESLTLCAKHQKRIADDVLQMSKLSMNLVSLTEVPFDPLVETSNVIRMFEREAFVKGITFGFTIGEQYRALKINWVLADPIRFSQVLLNFISNAVRFTEKAPTRTIDVSLDASVEEPNLSQTFVGANATNPNHIDRPLDQDKPIYLIASVADTGIGLTPEERSNLFQKFAQASPKTHSEYGGSGLGLFISRALVEVQGGRISLESEKNKGTTLTFYIRAQMTKVPDEIPAVKSSSPRNSIPRIRRIGSSASVPQMKPVNVLVVEDNLINQKVLTRQLQLAGFQTAVANHGLECLHVLEKAAATDDTFDVICLDLEMPILNGIDAAAEIRKREKQGKLPGHTPIIAVTGNARREYIDKGTSLENFTDAAKSIGIESFIVKPYEKQDLIEKIRNLTFRG